MRIFRESDHPRHPPGSGRESGRFRHGGLSSVYRGVHAVDASWAEKLSQQIDNRTGGGTWQPMTPLAYRSQWRQEMLAELRRQGTGAASEDVLAQLEADAPTPAAVYRNGPHRVVVESDRDLPDGFLEAVSDLQRRYPGRGPSTITLLDRRAMPNERGLTLFPASIVFIRDDMLDKWDKTANIAMPSARRTEQWRYVLAHEWGHAISPTDLMTSTKSQDMVEDYGHHLSEYGASHRAEAIGEAFAEWYLTGGQTNNPGVLAYARWLGWDQ